MRTSDTSRFCASSAARRAATVRGAIAVSETGPAKRASGIWLCSSATLPWSEMPRLARYAEYLAVENLPSSWNSGALVIASITASRLMNMCARAVSLASSRWVISASSTICRDSGESSSAGSTAPPNMRRICSCWRRSSSANSRCEISLPFTLATASRPPRNCVYDSTPQIANGITSRARITCTTRLYLWTRSNTANQLRKERILPDDVGELRRNRDAERREGLDHLARRLSGRAEHAPVRDAERRARGARRAQGIAPRARALEVGGQELPPIRILDLDQRPVGVARDLGRRALPGDLAIFPRRPRALVREPARRSAGRFELLQERKREVRGHERGRAGRCAARRPGRRPCGGALRLRRARRGRRRRSLPRAVGDQQRERDDARRAPGASAE